MVVRATVQKVRQRGGEGRGEHKGKLKHPPPEKSPELSQLQKAGNDSFPLNKQMSAVVSLFGKQKEDAN